MSWSAIEQVIAHSKAVGAARLLLLVIAHHINKDGYTWLSEATLVNETRISRRHLIRLLPQLEAEGELCIERHGVGRGHAFTYRLPAKGATTSPFPEKGDVVASEGCHGVRKRVTSDAEKGDALSPLSSVVQAVDRDVSPAGVLAHEESEANGKDVDSAVHGSVAAAERSADEKYADGTPDPSDWEEAWKQRYDREVTPPLTRPPHTHTLVPPPPSDPEAAVHTLAAGLAAKATMLVEDVEARRTRLRAQSQWLMANGY
jgi:hypothetical protein